MMALDRERLGLAGVTGLGLLCFCASLYISTLSPLAAEVDALQAQVLRIQSEKLPEPLPPASNNPLPSSQATEATELIKLLDAAAQQRNLSIAHTAYRLRNDERQPRLEVSVPLKGKYPDLRLYLGDLQALNVGMTIEALSMQRAQASDPLLDANLKLSVAVKP